MKLQLSSNRVTLLNLLPSLAIEGYEDFDDFSFMHKPVFFDRKSKKFKVNFSLNLKIQSSYLLMMEYESEFELDNEVDEAFISSSFPHVNAPAIGFPYLRAFVSTFLLNGGYEPVMLPSINFSAMHKNKTKQSS